LVIPLANIISVTLTLKDGASGTIVNSRDAQGRAEPQRRDDPRDLGPIS
jgi:hypothetical protein